ncbi:MAG: type ISP restriction/modification enzyme [Thalassobaculaceae bacterium]
MAGKKSLAEVVAKYGADTKAKLSSPTVTGAPEDQLRNPLENLFKELAEIAGYPPAAVSLVGETTIASLSTRPDFAVTLANALIGHIEVKAPGKGADPRKFSDKHDKTQWSKLKSLPNILYTDGNSFSLWRDGEIAGKVVHLNGDVETSGKGLTAPAELMPLFSDFLSWNPQPPKTARELASISARLCRLLRDEVEEELAEGSASLRALATEWRDLLFPEATDKQFADGYAQAVTFGLLMAKSRDIDLSSGLGAVALKLIDENSLIGSALRLLTDDAATQKALETSLDTLVRVLDVVHWPTLAKGSPDAWLYFYEDFLAVYDNTLRKSTGSYYTPPEVVETMIRLVDEALRDPALFGRPMGLADDNVRIADPAVGTGTYLLGVLRRIAKTVEDDKGAGAVPGEINNAIKRLIGFELQFGPFAVAQLRLIAEILELTGAKGGALPVPRLFITDTLGDPYEAITKFSSMLAPIGKSREDANKIKREEEITVVIGNPPYKEKAKGRGGWIEDGTTGREAPLERWMPPSAWGVSTHAKHLRNLYVYFWRWATWKVFGSGYTASTKHEENDGEAEKNWSGIVCFITVAGFLNGPGFQKMRDDLRRESSHIWVIDCSPEGHQPEVATRIFQGVQQPVCIVLAARPTDKDETKPAELHFRSLATGSREAKFVELAKVALTGTGWADGFDGWRDPFLAKTAGAWAAFPTLDDLFVYNGSGVMSGRTWVIAPDQGSLSDRWDALIKETDPAKKEVLFHPHQDGDRTLAKLSKSGLVGHEFRSGAVAGDTKSVVKPCRYSFRSFDRQWLIPDNRLINRANPTLWAWHSTKQVYLTSPEDRTPTNGPTGTICGDVPDLHHYHGRGGRAFPLWQDASATIPNIKSAMIAHLGAAYGKPVGAEDVVAYIAALVAHPNFTSRFANDLRQPGLRVPITADAALFAEAAELGREIIWVQCYGERMADPANGRPHGAPRLPVSERPTIPKGGELPGASDPLPDEMAYDAAKKQLHIGKGYVDNVTKAMWEYEVSGKNVLRQWFSYRRRDRSKPQMGDRRPPSPLDSIQPDHWLPEYTADLINLLNVLGWLVKLESKQKDLLDRILAGKLLDRDTLEAAGALTGPPKAKGSKKTADSRQASLI